MILFFPKTLTLALDLDLEHFKRKPCEVSYHRRGYIFLFIFSFSIDFPLLCSRSRFCCCTASFEQIRSLPT